MKRVPITLSHAQNGVKLRPMIGAVIYVRVSDPRQAENLSLATQLKACEEYCERQGFVVLERFREQGESAKTADRTELQRLLQYCRTNKGKVHFVVVFNLTRFAREKYDHFALRAHLKSLGISLRSATEPIDDTATGKLMEGVLAAFAQFDNDVRSDRTKAGMRAALELGRWTFLAPIGYLNAPRWSGKSLVEDPERAPLVRRAFEQFSTGRYTKQQVLEEVTRLGLRSRRGLRVSSQTFDAVLENQLYIGVIRCRRVRHASEAWRLRAADRRKAVLPRAGHSESAGSRDRAPAAQSSRFPVTCLREMPRVRPAADRKLVEGAQRTLRVLPLPRRRVSRCEYREGEDGRTLRGRARAVAADVGVHAARERARDPGVGSSEVRREGES